MRWNWQHPDWPDFDWQADRLVRAEHLFTEQAGIVIGVSRHLDEEARQALTIDWMTDEARSTSEIEGELLDRNSIQASIRRRLGLEADRRSGPAEAGIAEMMVDLYQHAEKPLDDATLFGWHRMLMNGRRDITDIGWYRCHDDPMEVVSGPVHRRRVHFVAPPSKQVPDEMARFLKWFHATRPAGKTPLPCLARAGIAHLRFESIHPFEDGNGRIGRAIVEKALAEGASRPVLTGVAGTIARRRPEYYREIEAANKTLEATRWLRWFAAVAIEAQRRSIAQVEFVLDKARLLGAAHDRLNSRQERAILRMFEEGPDGFKGGMSAANYMTITGAPPATTTRDLGELVRLGVLTRTGVRKSTRYHLASPHRGVAKVEPDDIDPAPTPSDRAHDDGRPTP